MSADSNVAGVGLASAKENHLLNFIKDNATLIALIVLVVGLSFADDAFFTARNLSNLSRQVTIIGIIAVGMTMVILIAGIDLSVGSVVGLSAVVCTVLMQYGVRKTGSLIRPTAIEIDRLSFAPAGPLADRHASPSGGRMPPSP